jgi:hypothetical protein
MLFGAPIRRLESFFQAFFRLRGGPQGEMAGDIGRFRRL